MSQEQQKSPTYREKIEALKNQEFAQLDALMRQADVEYKANGRPTAETVIAIIHEVQRLELNEIEVVTRAAEIGLPTDPAAQDAFRQVSMEVKAQFEAQSPEQTAPAPAPVQTQPTPAPVTPQQAPVQTQPTPAPVIVQQPAPQPMQPAQPQQPAQQPAQGEAKKDEGKKDKKEKDKRSPAGEALDELYGDLDGLQKTGVVAAKYGGATLSLPAHAVIHTALFGWDVLKAGAHHVVQTGRDTAKTARGLDTATSLYFSGNDELKGRFAAAALQDREGALKDCGLDANALEEMAKAIQGKAHDAKKLDTTKVNHAPAPAQPKIDHSPKPVPA